MLKTTLCHTQVCVTTPIVMSCTCANGHGPGMLLCARKEGWGGSGGTPSEVEQVTEESPVL